ncbi:MAG: PrsW family glutamic-type intramembrane protease [Halobacteriota archaeon]
MEMERWIDEMITLGYDVKDRGVGTAILKKKSWGDVAVIIVLLVIAFVLAIFTLGLSFLLPIAYIVFKHQTADTIEVKIDPPIVSVESAVQPKSHIPPSEAQTFRDTPTPQQIPPPATQADSNYSTLAPSSANAQYLKSTYLYSSRTKDRLKHLSRFNQVDLLILLVSLIWGTIAGVIVALPLEVVLNVPDGLAAFIEEPAKILPLIVLAIWYPFLLYSKKKCATFGAIAGLGFGAVENLWYFVHVPKEFFEVTVVARTAFLPGHLMYSAIAALSLMYIASRRQRYYAVLLMSLAILFHLVWNSVTPALIIYIILYALLIVLFILIYWTVPNQVVDPNVTPTTLDELSHRDLISES